MCPSLNKSLGPESYMARLGSQGQEGSCSQSQGVKVGGDGSPRKAPALESEEGGSMLYRFTPIPSDS